MSRFEKEVLPFIEEEIMRKLRTYNVYSIKEYEDIRKYGIGITQVRPVLLQYCAIAT